MPSQSSTRGSHTAIQPVSQPLAMMKWDPRFRGTSKTRLKGNDGGRSEARGCDYTYIIAVRLITVNYRIYIDVMRLGHK